MKKIKIHFINGEVLEIKGCDLSLIQTMITDGKTQTIVFLNILDEYTIVLNNVLYIAGVTE